MSFRISKASFSFHIIRLYCRFCSTFILLLFFMIALAKWIQSLHYFVFRFNDSSMKFTISESALLSLIQWKADVKLLKQKLLYEFWWYCISGTSGWNCTFFLFCITNWYSKYLIIFVLSPRNLVWYIFYRNLVHVSWKFLSTNHDQYRTNFLLFLIVLGSYIFLSYIFLFYHLTIFCGS